MFSLHWTKQHDWTPVRVEQCRIRIGIVHSLAVFLVLLYLKFQQVGPALFFVEVTGPIMGEICIVDIMKIVVYSVSSHEPARGATVI